MPHPATHPHLATSKTSNVLPEPPASHVELPGPAPNQAAQRAISALDKKEVRTSTDRDPFLIEARLANRESESAADDEHGRRKTERPL